MMSMLEPGKKRNVNTDRFTTTGKGISMRTRTITASLGVLAMLASAAASSATLQLTNVYTKPGSNPGAPLTISGNALFEYTPGSSLVAQGEWIGTAEFANNLIYEVRANGMVIDISNSLDVNTTTASSFSCTEGTFLSMFGANGCGNYNMGEDYVDETTLDYSSLNPTRVSAPGSDDWYYGDMQSLWDYTNMQIYNFDPVAVAGNTAFILSNRTGGAESGDGFSMTFAYVSGPVVPVPAAVWLFGSALSLLAWTKRKADR